MSEDVPLGDPSSSAGPSHLAGIDLFLGHDPTHRRGERDRPYVGVAGHGGCPPWRCAAGALSLCGGRCGRGRRRLSFGVDGADRGPDVHGLTLGDVDLQDARGGRRDDVVRLVGLELEQGFARFDGRTVGLEPASTGSLR